MLTAGIPKNAPSLIAELEFPTRQDALKISFK